MSKTFWLLSAGLTALATPAYAQNAPAGADRRRTDDQAIVVTAQGRRQILQDVPLAVSAVNAESMQNSGANDIRQLNQLAPSLLVSSTGTEANGSARIRGIGTVGDNPGLESSVAVFIDGVYRSRSGIGLNELGEIDRVEVLRGPQGTLFGRNASAGLIHVITQRPRIRVRRHGRAHLRQLRLYPRPDRHHRPDHLAARRPARRRLYPPRRLLPGRQPDRRHRKPGQRPRPPVRPRPIAVRAERRSLDPPDRRLYAGARNPAAARSIPRRARPSIRRRACRGDFAYQQPGAGGSPSGNRIVDILTSLGGVLPSNGNPYNRLISVSPGRSFEGETRDWGVSAQVDWDLGGARLTSITAFRNYRSEQPGDVDYNNVDILFRADDGNAFRRFETFTQELRLQGQAFGGRLDWLVGAYFASEDLQVRDNLTVRHAIWRFRRLPPGLDRQRQSGAARSGAAGLPERRAAGGAPVGSRRRSAPPAPVMLAGLDRLSTVNNRRRQQRPTISRRAATGRSSPTTSSTSPISSR